jgi:energy-coupling factor transport system permease protein
VTALLGYERESFLQRLNPLTKLLVATVVILGLTVIVDPVTPLIVTLAVLFTVCLLGRVRPREILRLYWPVWILSLGVLWTTTVFYVADPGSQPRVIGAVGPAVITDQGIAYALVIFFRLQGFYAASLLYVLTTDPTDLVQSLVQNARLSYRFCYGAHAAYRFVPLFQGELAAIRAAHRVRGVPDGGGPLTRARQYISYLVPLIAGGVRKAERVALAMDARGFGAYPVRTYYRRSRFCISDLAFGIGATMFLVGTLVELHSLGWLGELIPPFIASNSG